MTILAAVDGGAESEEAVSVAYDLATTYDDLLVVLHVVPEEDFQSHRESVTSVPGFRDFSYTQEENTAAQFARRVVDRALGEFDRSVVETRGRIGNAADEILAEAEDVDARYLVIGGKRRSPVGKALFGSETQRIVLDADCPVVTTITD